MELFMFSFPLMVLAVALAVLPLIVISHTDNRRRATEELYRGKSQPEWATVAS